MQLLGDRADLALARLPVLGRRFAAAPVPVGLTETPTGHAIVVGYGRVGRAVTAGLRAAGLPVLVIEEDLHLIHELTAAGIPAIYGDASYRRIMDAAGAGRARLILVALPDAGATRVVVLNARRVNPDAPILARVARGEHDAAIRRAGATTTVAPERAGAVLLLEESAHALGLPVDAVLGMAPAGVERGRPPQR